MSPEIYNNQQYQGQPADCYALGKLLFFLKAKIPPFTYPNKADRFYRILNQDPEAFWKLHSSKHPPGYFSDDFKRLIMGMLAEKPEKRLTITEIKMHPWCAGRISPLNRSSMEAPMIQAI